MPLADRVPYRPMGPIGSHWLARGLHMHRATIRSPRPPTIAASPTRSNATKMVANMMSTVPSVMFIMPLLRPHRNVANGRGVQLTTASRRDPSSIQCSCNVPQSGSARLLGFADDGYNIGGKLVGRCRHRPRRAPAGHVEPWVSKGYPAGLCCRKSLPCSRGDEGALLFCKGREQVQHERVHVWP